MFKLDFDCKITFNIEQKDDNIKSGVYEACGRVPGPDGAGAG